MTGSPPLWTPAAQRIRSSQLRRFCALAAQHGAPRVDGTDPIADFHALWQWSVRERAGFWRAVLELAAPLTEGSPDPALLDGDRMPGAQWFPHLRLNFAETLLRGSDETIALVFANERGERRELSRSRLGAEVAALAALLEEEGVRAGDVVAGYLPNIPEAVVGMLAAASIGAVWTSCSPDFGLAGLSDRFGQVAPKVLIVADGAWYAGKRVDSLPVVRALLEKLAGITSVLVVPYLEARPDLAGLPRARLLPDATRGSAPQPRFARLPFAAPLYVLYSSGTTGTPKCIVHGAGGTLLQHVKEHLLHVDVQRGDKLFFYTTTGWMMWNWLISGLASGATLVLYDGSPLHPGPGVLWDLAERERIGVFGTSPRYLAALAKAGFSPARDRDLGALRTVLSTGSPLDGALFDFVYREISQDVHLASISGGTDIVSCFCLGAPWLPVYRGEIQAAGLGMATAVWDEHGREVRGERGELVCTRSFPAMPLGFVGDEDGARYRAAYFERFPGVWHHGDYALRTPHEGFVILGRSDAVLNPGGVRIGTAEIYRQVEQLPEVLESLAIGQEWQADTRVVLFVRLREGVALDASLEQRIREAIRRNASPRHVPAVILAVPEMPRTLSGKLVELAVREVVHGRPVKNVDALANPQALEHFRDRRELQQEERPR